jgi:hypothetical protein
MRTSKFHQTKHSNNMEAKTMTTAGELRIGDSFVYPRRTDPWRVVALSDKNGRVAVNQVINGGNKYRHDELIRAAKKVMFLRHTIPVPGEMCYMIDLVPGDVFHIPDDLVNEYQVEKVGDLTIRMRRLDQAYTCNAGIMAKGVFVRHPETIK